MRKLFSVLSLCLLMVFGVSAQDSVEEDIPKAHVNWVSMEDALASAEQDGKKILIDVYTDWCGWCKVMERNTYTDPTVVGYVNANYHAVQFDAEQKEELIVGDKTFKFVPQGRKGYHEFAAYILQGKMSYPTTVFMDSDKSLIYAVPGYQKAPAMTKIIRYTKEEAYKTTPFDQYQ